MTKADVIQQERYSRSKVPMNEIESNAKTLRPMSEITDAQAELVHMMLHDGCNPTEASKRLGRNKDATQALATMRELLTAKSSYIRLEASKDLMDRAGMRVDAPRQANTAVNINFNVD